MPSDSYRDRLERVLDDADEINERHADLRTGSAGRQYGLGALNRAVVVMCVSAWEAYLEALVNECMILLRPGTPPLGVWPALNVSVRTQVGRFNNPTVQNTKELIASCIGLEDITSRWSWQHTSPQSARERLDKAISLRHQVAHGIMPRPIIHNHQYSSRLPGFFRKLGKATDDAITDYLRDSFGLNTGW